MASAEGTAGKGWRRGVRLLPHPWLSVLLLLVWLMLVRQNTVGNVVLGLAIATGVPLLTTPLWPERPRLRNPHVFLWFGVIVLWDVLRSNFAVARVILFTPAHRIRTCWIAVPLDIRSPEGIALLSGTITMTPGTLTADISACGRALLIHCLHAPDPAAVVAEIKTRYEARLMRVFG
jgi:multicomponent K+:H+ antiporter subunit E